MKRSVTTSSMANNSSETNDQNNNPENKTSNLLKPSNNVDNITKSMNHLSVSSSSATLNSSSGDDSGNSGINKSNSSNNLSEDNNKDTDDAGFKLTSPYGDWCAFSGGGGSGGCIVTGPYEPMIIPKDDFSDESFESTEESDAAIDLTGPVGVTHNNFQNTEVVWAKRPALPWFPGIIIDPNAITKEIKELMKSVGASHPHKDQLSDYSTAFVNSKQTDRLFFIFLFNKKKTWIWLTESKLRPFCKENDRLFLENSPLLTTKYKKELEKAYKKAKQYAKHYVDDDNSIEPNASSTAGLVTDGKSSKNNHHHHHHHHHHH